MSTEPTRTPDTTPNRTTDPRAGAPTATKRESWTAPDEAEPFTAAKAPRTFDPFCTRRLRNCCDDRNAAHLAE